MMRPVHVLLLAMLAATAPAMAQQTEPPATPMPSQRARDVPVGDRTRTLLDIQRNGTQAGPLLPLTGEQAALGYARYLRSFAHPLPEFFTTMATGSPLRGGAGSQQTNGPSGYGQ